MLYLVTGIKSDMRWIYIKIIRLFISNSGFQQKDVLQQKAHPDFPEKKDTLLRFWKRQVKAREIRFS
jgi:hypothetical protein